MLPWNVFGSSGLSLGSQAPAFAATTYGPPASGTVTGPPPPCGHDAAKVTVASFSANIIEGWAPGTDTEKPARSSEPGSTWRLPSIASGGVVMGSATAEDRHSAQGTTATTAARPVRARVRRRGSAAMTGSLFLGAGGRSDVGERRPVERVLVAFGGCRAGVAERGCRLEPATEAGVEVGHRRGSDLVVDQPLADDRSCRACSEERPCEADGL